MSTKEKVEAALEATAMNAVSKEEEFDYVAGFFKAVETLKGNTEKVAFARLNEETGEKEKAIEFSVHALTGNDARIAKKKASTRIPNPVNKKLPPIVKEVNEVIYQSYLIYLATTDEDRKKYWDNPLFRDKCGVMEGYELIDIALLPGEKQIVLDTIDTLSGYGFSDVDYDENEANDTETAKN